MNGEMGEKRISLLLSFVNPHKEVVKSTIAGWIKFVLSQVGIDTDIFKAHSTRAASSSKVKSKIHTTGLSIQDILKRGNWSNKTSETYEEVILSK